MCLSKVLSVQNRNFAIVMFNRRNEWKQNLKRCGVRSYKTTPRKRYKPVPNMHVASVPNWPRWPCTVPVIGSWLRTWFLRFQPAVRSAHRLLAIMVQESYWAKRSLSTTIVWCWIVPISVSAIIPWLAHAANSIHHNTPWTTWNGGKRRNGLIRLLSARIAGWVVAW